MEKENLPIIGFDSLKLKFLKKRDGYKMGYNLSSKKDIGIVFPFCRNLKDLEDYTKSILGYMYPTKMSFVWEPKVFKIKELLFKKQSKRFRFEKNSSIKEKFEMLNNDAMTFKRNSNKNYLFDFSKVLNELSPDPLKYPDLWKDTRPFKGVDKFIEDWLSLIFVTDKINSEIFSCDGIGFGGSITNTHKKSILGINVSTLDSTFKKYVDPTKDIPNNLKKENMKDYIDLVFIRSITANLLGYRDDYILNKIYDLIKDKSIVFLNNRGVSFIYNTENDEVLEKYKGEKSITKLKELYGKLISFNDPSLELEDEEEDSVIPVYNDENIKNETLLDVKETSTKTNVLENIAVKDSLFGTKKLDSLDEDIDDENDDIPLEGEEGTDGKDIDGSKRINLLRIIENNNNPKMTPAKIRRLETAKKKYKSINIDGRTVEEILNDVNATTIDITKSKEVIRDESLSQSSLIDLEKSYVEKTLDRDILKVVESFSENKSINIHITDVEKKDTSDIDNDKYTYSFRFKDDNDKVHKFSVDIPKVGKDNMLYIGGNRKFLKKQLTQLPVTKPKPDLVILSSNHNKCFMYRHGNVVDKRLSTLNKLLSNNLIRNSKVKIFGGNSTSSNSSILTTIEYDNLSSNYFKIVIGKIKSGDGVEYIFDQKELRDKISKMNSINYTYRSDRIPIGIDHRNLRVIEVSYNKGSVSEKILNDLIKYEVLPDIEELIRKSKAPKRRMVSKLIIQSKDIVTVSFLGSLFGLSELIKREDVETKVSEKLIRDSDMVYIKFKDKYLYYDDTNKSAALLLNGLAYMDTDSYNMEEFDTIKPYIDYFEKSTKSRNVFKGYTAFRELFIDSITLEVLRDKNLPTEFLELFLYGNSLLTDNSYTVETDLSNYRIRGYEVLPVLLYKAMASQYILFKQNNYGTNSVKVQKDSIIMKLHTSFILENLDTTSPVNELKNKSIVTMKGPGGVNSDKAYTILKRSYSKTGIGTIAISSTDSGNVGIVKQLTLNPSITSTRGYIDICNGDKEAEKKKLGQLASPEESDVAFANRHDDPKRLSFVSGQTKHIVKVKKSSPPIISTGMDKVMSNYVGDTFVPKAKYRGVVSDLDEKKGLITISYDNGEVETFEVSDNIVRNSSFYFKNEYVINVKLNQKVSKGDIIAYEKDFFKENHSGLRAAHGVNARLALHEGTYTDDDSSAISKRLARKLSTTVINCKKIMLSTYVNIISMVNIGDHVIKGDPLMVFEDSRDADYSGMVASLGDVSEEILEMAKQVPKSPMSGFIKDINVIYTKPLEEYTDSCLEVINSNLKRIDSKIRKLKSVGNKKEAERLALTKELVKPSGNNRLRGEIVPDEGGLLIEIFIEHDNDCSVGNKITFSGNIKSIVAHTFEEDPVTEDGQSLDGVIGEFSVLARMAMSPLMSGILGNVLVEYSRRIAKEYLE